MTVPSILNFMKRPPKARALGDYCARKHKKRFRAPGGGEVFYTGSARILRVRAMAVKCGKDCGREAGESAIARSVENHELASRLSAPAQVAASKEFRGFAQLEEETRGTDGILKRITALQEQAEALARKREKVRETANWLSPLCAVGGLAAGAAVALATAVPEALALSALYVSGSMLVFAALGGGIAELAALARQAMLGREAKDCMEHLDALEKELSAPQRAR
jgi:hypothetical protein